MSRIRAKLAVALIAALVVFGVLFAVGYVLYFPVAPAAPETRVIKIPSGSSLQAIVDSLRAAGVIRAGGRFRLATRILGKEGQLKSGMFRIPARASHRDILDMLTSGRVATQRVTIPEGSTARTIAGIMQRTLEVDSTRFMALVQDSVFARELGVEAAGLEGYLFPDTYKLTWGMRPEQIIRILVDQFRRVYDDSLRRRTDELGMTTHEVVTLASIIEGEAMRDDERPIISAVYHNRLRAGWLLQADPTIQYVIADGPRRLLNSDLEVDSPYNTYKYPGLPSGPVNNPGRRSIEAALFPADVDYLYFVANGDGSHTFSRTMREHLAAKRKLDGLRRELLRQTRREKDGG